MKTLLFPILPFLAAPNAIAGDIQFACTGENYGALVYPDAHDFPVMHVYVQRGASGPLVTDLTVPVDKTSDGYRSIAHEGVFTEGVRLTRQADGGYLLVLNQGFLGAYSFRADECR